MILFKKYVCHICGYDGLDEEPYLNGGDIPSREICDCCGCEFGYDDHEGHRRKWIESGGNWFSKELKPEGWSMKTQLRNINIEI